MESLYTLIEMVVKNIVVVLVLMGCVAYTTLLERKLLGRLQVRPVPTGWGLSVFFSRSRTASSPSQGRYHTR